MPVTESDRRLLSACNAAYCVHEGAIDTDSMASYAARVGFLAEPRVFFSGTGGVHSCLIGPTDVGIVVAFRGTLPIDDESHSLEDRVHDWINDFRARLVTHTSYPGRVHGGFASAVDVLWPSVRNELNRLGAGNTNARVMFTGHSKGGAMATLSGWRWWQETSEKPSLTTFLAPQTGNTEFAQAFQLGLELRRFEFQNDIVSHTPPHSELIHWINAFRDEGTNNNLDDHLYEPVGRLLFMDWDGVLREPSGFLDSLFLQGERLIRIGGAITTDGFDSVIAAHKIGEGSDCWNFFYPA